MELLKLICHTSGLFKWTAKKRWLPQKRGDYKSVKSTLLYFFKYNTELLDAITLKLQV